ncbi:MAG: hypothetical protein CMJ87_11720 [Planctomycetes bacterium]|nr:hypothetical protein [Planctomycetota bacterium]
MLLVSAALYASGLAAKTRKAESSSGGEPEYVPFSSLPEEQPPGRSAGPGSNSSRGGTRSAASRLGTAPGGGDERPAPGSSLDTVVWKGALDEAALGYALAREAATARAAGNHALFQEKGGGAKRAFDRALTQSVPFVERLMASSGDTDPAVRKALAIQGRWREQLIAFHKTTGR